ncbi:Alkyl transferase [Aphelenchoides fujianensis]|nr:Alkyl transferase [Aphelenchoides fujianensis]
MSLVGTNRLPWFGNVAARLLSLHPIPKHVGFIMDGNRRYARVHQLDNVVDGHAKGFDQLIRVVEWSIHLGVREVTVYAFSLENFKRSEQEVQRLQELAKERFEELLKSRQLENIGVRIRFFGNKSKFPEDVRKTMDDVKESTRKFCRGIINICVAYTAQYEIVRTMQRVQADVQRGDLKARFVLPISLLLTSSVCFQRVFSFDPPIPLTCLQCGNAFVYFDNVLWPDFGFWHFFKALFQYQLHTMKTRKPLAVACSPLPLPFTC